jgi:Uma2 family endonuclease
MSVMSSMTSPVPAVTAFPEGDALFEILDGVRVEIPNMSAFATLIASRLLGELHLFLKKAACGQAVMETLFRIMKDRNRRADVAYVSFERWPKGRPQGKDDNAWDVVPDLAVEVVSPHDLVEELQEKIDEYFRAGVALVWIVFPKHALIYVYESPSQVRILTRGDTLEGGRVLPEFRLPLAELFVEE